MKPASVLLMGILLVTTRPMGAGVFLFSDDPSYDNPGMVVHPYGYTGLGPTITVNVCISASALQIQGEIQAAIDFWNGRPAAVGNCSGPCSTLEDTPPPQAEFAIVSTIVHELGHCALGLHHPNRDQDSRTRSYLATSIGEPATNPDNVPGSSDDVVSPLPGTRLIHWYRVGTNDPFIVDGATIDNSSLSRVFANLPAGHNWAANGNRRVGSLLGQPVFTHSLMYSLTGPATAYSAFIADDVNQVLYAEAGLLEVAGDEDDYTTQLALVEDCNDADIEMRFATLPGGNDRPLGLCDHVKLIGIPIPGQALRHYHLSPTNTPWPYAVVTIDRATGWDVSSLPFSDGFELGDLSLWSLAPEP